MEQNRAIKYIAGASFAICGIISFIILKGTIRLESLLPVISYAMITISIFLSIKVLAIIGCFISIIHCIIRFINIFRYTIRYSDYSLFIQSILLLLFWVMLLVANIDTSNKKICCYTAAGIIIFRLFFFFFANYSMGGIVNIIYTVLQATGAVTMGFVTEEAIKRDSIAQINKKQQKNSLSIDQQIDQLTRLQSLREKGIITEKEFSEKKQKILNMD